MPSKFRDPNKLAASFFPFFPDSAKKVCFFRLFGPGDPPGGVNFWVFGLRDPPRDLNFRIWPIFGFLNRMPSKFGGPEKLGGPFVQKYDKIVKKSGNF